MVETVWTPIPEYPPYTINVYGVVRNEFGQDLSTDDKDRVLLRVAGGKKRKVRVDVLLELAGIIRGAAPEAESEDAAALRRELDDARATISKGRRLNAHLINLVRNLRGQIEELSRPKGRGRPSRGQVNEEDLMPPMEFF